MAQNYIPVTEFRFPEKISQNSPFDVSLITDNSVVEADSFHLYIITENRIDFNSIIFNSNQLQNELRITLSGLEGISARVYKAVIPLTGNQGTIQSVFQVLINCSPINSESVRLNLYGEFIKHGRVVTKIGKATDNFNESGNPLSASILKYKPNRLLKNAARFELNSKLSVNLKSTNATNLWLGFWIKLSGSDQNIIKLVNTVTGNNVFTLGVNRFQKFFIVDDNNEKINFVSDFYSRKSWNHIGLDISLSDGTLHFYFNGSLLLEYEFNNIFELTNHYYLLSNNSKANFTIEQLRLIAHNNNNEIIISDSEYLSVTPENTSAILQLNFDTWDELLSLSESKTISYRGIKLVSSDAPITSRAPELNVNVAGTYYQLEWEAPDLNNAYEFIVERSASNNGFQEIANISASGNPTKKFSYIDAVPNEKNEIIYYRIKQINKDGSIVYSVQVKIGMGDLEQFKVNQNYPNPFNPITSIEVDLFMDNEMEVIIYNLEGQEMAVLHRGFLPKGIHKFEFDAGHLPSGVYLYKVSAGNFSQTNKMILTK